MDDPNFRADVASVGRRASRALRALLSPKRAIPLLSFAALLALLEYWWQPRLAVGLYTLILSLALMLLATLGWCVLEASPIGRVFHCVLGGVWVLLFGLIARRGLGLPETLLTDSTGLVAMTGGVAVGGYAIGRDILLEQALGQAEHHAQYAQLLALRNQLDPHFLFNTLNAIAEWCRDAPEVAEQATLRLSAMLRSILEAVRQPRWPLERELTLVADLFLLYGVRDPERFVLQSRVEAGLDQVHVPPLLLLSLVENAIKHGPAAGWRGPITLEVSRSADESMLVSVRNGGEYLGPRAGGEGLRLIEQRLTHAYAGRARFAMRGVGTDTLAELWLPLAEGAHE